MIRIAVMSDLHLEAHSHWANPDLRPLRSAKIDLLLLPGDISNDGEAISFAVEAHYEIGCPVVLCAGNHDFYRDEINKALDDMRYSIEQFAALEKVYPQVF